MKSNSTTIFSKRVPSRTLLLGLATLFAVPLGMTSTAFSQVNSPLDSTPLVTDYHPTKDLQERTNERVEQNRDGIDDRIDQFRDRQDNRIDNLPAGVRDDVRDTVDERRERRDDLRNQRRETIDDYREQRQERRDNR